MAQIIGVGVIGMAGWDRRIAALTSRPDRFHDAGSTETGCLRGRAGDRAEQASGVWL